MAENQIYKGHDLVITPVGVHHLHMASLHQPWLERFITLKPDGDNTLTWHVHHGIEDSSDTEADQRDTWLFWNFGDAIQCAADELTNQLECLPPPRTLQDVRDARDHAAAHCSTLPFWDQR